MKKKILIAASLLLLFTNLPAQETASKDIAVTVYNNNLGVIKETRELNLTSGISTIRITDVAQLIDPTSVHIKFNGSVLEQNYQYDLVSLNKILQKYIDKKISLIGKNNEFIEGTLLSSGGNQIVLRQSDGGLVMLPGISDYRISVGELPDGLITKPTLIWTVLANSSGKSDAEISYQTGGMSWHAEYVAVLNKDDNKMDLNSWVSIDNNSGTTYNNAKLKLVAGDVNIITQPPKYRGQDVLYTAEKSLAQDQFSEKDFFEYHIYNLERPTTISNNEIKQISLFESEDISVDKKYIYLSGSYGNSGKVAVFVEFKNSENNKLGVPMPKGKVRVYKSDGDAIEFIGEDLIDHTPRNEKLKLKIGDAFDVVAEEIQTEHKKITDRVYENEFKITLKNRKKSDVTVYVERYLGYNWEILNSTHNYEKKKVDQVEFEVPAKADSETELIFRVRYRN